MQIQPIPANERVLLSRVGLLEQRLAALTGQGMLAGAFQDDVPAFCEIDAECQHETATGFHRREYNENGQPFRWAGKGDHFEFRFFLDRRVARPFHLHGLFAPGVRQESLRCFVDYKAIQVDRHLRSGMATVTGRIPAEPLSSAVTLTFICPPAAPPPASRDIRTLSFAFSTLTVGRRDPG